MHAKRPSPGSPLRRPPSSTAWRYAIPASSTAAATEAWLNCGLRREPGKRRTSTSVWTPAPRSVSTSSSRGRTPWPMVKTVMSARIESRPRGTYGRAMAGSVTWTQLRELAGFRTDKGCAISLYLNLDPSEVPTPGDAQTRMNAVLSEAEKTARLELAHDARAGLKADFRRIARWFDDDLERDGAHGLAVFAAGLDNYWSTFALPEPVPDGVRVGRDFYLAPLIPLVARTDGTIVAVVGREQG